MPQRAGQQTFDLALRCAVVRPAELHADALRPLVLSAARRYPDHLAGDRNALRVFHQREQHEHLVAQSVFLGRGHEQPPFLTNGMYAADSEVLSLMLSVRMPGWVGPLRGDWFMSV